MNDGNEKVVRISLDGNGKPLASPDRVEVNKNKHKVRWCADFQFSIEIAGSPGISSSAGMGGCAHGATAGPFKTETGTTPLKYSITANGKVLDPEIDVKP